MHDVVPTSGSAVISIDAASALSQGRRDYQEDAVVVDFARGTDFGFAVLADGMGGHASGELASKIVVTEVFSELMLQRNDPAAFESDVAGALRRAADAANESIQACVASDPAKRGMGATLVATVILRDRLHWISIGDSPLYLFRDGVLRQLNEDHSMGPEIDLLVRMGELNAEEGRNHPERNVLTSVLFGKAIPRIDCPEAPFQLYPGDLLIVASDGLQFLPQDRIERVLRDHPLSRSDQLADILLTQVEALDDPDLDNVSLSVIRIVNIADIAPRPRPESVMPRAAPAASPLRRILTSSRRLLGNTGEPRHEG